MTFFPLSHLLKHAAETTEEPEDPEIMRRHNRPHDESAQPLQEGRKAGRRPPQTELGDSWPESAVDPAEGKNKKPVRRQKRGKRSDRHAARHPHLFLSPCSLLLCTVWNNIPFLPSSPPRSVKRSGPLIVMPITKPQEQPPHQNKVFFSSCFFRAWRHPEYRKQ